MPMMPAVVITETIIMVGEGDAEFKPTIRPEVTGPSKRSAIQIGDRHIRDNAHLKHRVQVDRPLGRDIPTISN